jgi:hypothetical protein
VTNVCAIVSASLIYADSAQMARLRETTIVIDLVVVSQEREGLSRLKKS